MSRDVLVTSFAPERRSGTGLRTCGVIAALAASRDVDVHYVAFEGRAPAPELARLAGVRLHRIVPEGGVRRGLAVGTALARGVPRDTARSVSRALLAAGEGTAPGDRIIADGPNVAAALLSLARRRPVHFLAHNLESAFRGELNGESRARALARFERLVLRRYEESWLATRADVTGARVLAGPSARLRYVPNVVDVAGTPIVSPPGSRTVLFVADFTYPPNQDALAFLTEDVLPAVWTKDPEVRMLLVGRGLDGRAFDARVESLGFIDDLETAYTRADVVCVPLRIGGGSPLKFVEALAHGLPVVASSHAAALIEEGTPGDDFLAAGDGQGFAAALLRVLDGDEPELGHRGRKLAERAYSVEALTELLGAL